MNPNNFFTSVLALVGGQITGPLDGPISEYTFQEGQTPPTKAEVDTKLAELNSAWNAQEYARNRTSEYPSLLELTVALYDTDDKSAVETKRAAVKAKYPKPE